MTTRVRLGGGSRRWLAIGLALALLGGCSQDASPPPNILMVVIDTLRADRVGARLGDRPLTPFLDSVAAHSYDFRRAYAQSPWTSPSVASLLTARYPSQHGVNGYRSVLGGGEDTLPEVLQAHGYLTAAVSANVMLNPKLGFAQGYDSYRMLEVALDGPEAKKVSARADRVQDAVLAWLDALPDGGRARPKFLYLQLMEPHAPYDPPQALLDEVLRVRGHAAPDADAINAALGNDKVKFADALVPAVRDLYDAEVASLDRQLAALFGALGARGFLDRAVVVVTADHGEEFNEHGRMGHRKDLYEEVLHVPLLISLPEQTAPVTVEEPVALIDLAPTLLTLVGVPIPTPFEGRPLLDAPARGVRGLVARVRRAFSHPAPPIGAELLLPTGPGRPSPHERAVIVGTNKVIAGVAGEREYYDLAADPTESHPDRLSAADRAVLEALLKELQAAPRIGGAVVNTGELDATTRERMRALGYGD